MINLLTSKIEDNLINIQRMQPRLDGEFLQVPEEIKSMQSFDDWLDVVTNSTSFDQPRPT